MIQHITALLSRMYESIISIPFIYTHLWETIIGILSKSNSSLERLYHFLCTASLLYHITSDRGKLLEVNMSYTTQNQSFNMRDDPNQYNLLLTTTSSAGFFLPQIKHPHFQLKAENIYSTCQQKLEIET